MSNLLDCQGITKTFLDGQRELKILRGVDLSIEAGKIYAISGASGAGKSTLLHIMGTLDRPSTGDVAFEGSLYSKMGRSTLNRLRNLSIGFVFQFYHLLPEFSAFENVMMPGLIRGLPKAQASKRAAELLAKVGLSERHSHKPGQLSGGEQQRVAIARALFNEPKLLLADEPTGNLDESTGVEIMDLLWGLNESDGVTLVLVTHDPRLAARADFWFELHDGTATLREQ